MKKTVAILAAAAFAVGGASLTACARKIDKQLTSYTIDATLSNDYVLTASVTCDYINNNDVPLDELWFHLYPNAYRANASVCPIPENRISEAFPDGRHYSKLDISKVSVNGSDVQITIAGTDEDILAVDVGKVNPLDRVTVTVDYTVALPKVRHRFGYNDNTVNLGNFYPVACVYRDGAFVADPYYSTGDPFFSETADYSVRLTVPDAYEGAFTGSVKSKTAGEGVCTYEVGASSVRDFAAVFGRFEKMSGLAGDTVVNYYYYKDSEPERALNTAIAAVKTFGDAFGKYAYPEYSVVQTEFLQGGMEYPQLSMISDGYTGDAYCDIVIHETAHQWWYAAVGSDQVKYPWLDEGLAEYSTMLFYEKNADAGYNYTFNGKRADALSAYTLYCETYKNNGAGDTSMTRPVNGYNDEIEYTYLTYVKGALMFDDIRNSVGTASFEKGLQKYYVDNKYEIAEPQNLIGAMEKASGRNLDGLFDCWLDGNVKLYVTK